uniref:Uncharacterized protein n=1 Tax=Panstrongylus lignarius TaxID=156445 RepID=A0A224XQJ2_9HEMI
MNLLAGHDLFWLVLHHLPVSFSLPLLLSFHRLSACLASLLLYPLTFPTFRSSWDDHETSFPQLVSRRPTSFLISILKQSGKVVETLFTTDLFGVHTKSEASLE